MFTNSTHFFSPFIFLASLLVVFCVLSTSLYAQDTPPVSANIETVKSGSYIIPMDEDKQFISRFFTFTGQQTVINIAAYGLVYRLLERGVPVKWAIRAGKSIDEVDFSALATPIYPTESTSANFDFKGGPFIISIDEMTAPDACNPNGSNPFPDVDELIESFGNEVKVYRLEEDTQIDIRYNLQIAPNISILNDGGWVEAQSVIFNDAFVPHNIISNAEFLTSASCNTFVAQPHIEEEEVNDAYTQTIQTFVEGGGNFLAQCVGLTSFENTGFFLTTNGIVDADTELVDANYSYLNADLAIMQLENEFITNLLGTTSSYSLENGSSWQPYAYRGIIMGNVSQGESLLVGGDLNGGISGGNIFYLGGHEITESFQESNWLPNDPQDMIQSQRIILNAAFIPANITFSCAGEDVCICKGESTTLGCGGEEVLGNDFIWTPSTGLSCTDCLNPVATPQSTTTYTMMAVDGKCGSSSVTVTVIEEPPMIDNLIVECIEGTETYRVRFEVIEGSTGTIDVSGDPFTVSGNLYESEAIESGIDYFFLVNDGLACDVEVSGTQNCVCETLNIDLGPDQTLCEGEILTLDADIGIEDATFLWQDGSTEAQLEANEPGIYEVTMQGAGCTISDAITLDFENCICDTLNIDLGPDQTLCEGQMISLSVDIGTEDATFLWQDGSTDFLFTAETTGTYNITVEAFGCTVSDEILLVFETCEPACRFEIPNSFSPNEDSVNDFFGPTSNCNFAQFEMIIYNRWGQQIFHSNEPTRRWDGMVDFRPVDIGVYAYYISYEFTENGELKSDSRQGNLTLIR